MGQANGQNQAKGAAKQARLQRQAEALRANLRRRKGQKRARAEEHGVEEPVESDEISLCEDQDPTDEFNENRE